MSDFLAVLFVIFILFSVFRRYIFFLVVNAVGKGLHKNMNKMYQQQQEPAAKKPQGHVTVEDNKTGKSAGQGSQIGEYVDYVDIKD